LHFVEDNPSGQIGDKSQRVGLSACADYLIIEGKVSVVVGSAGSRA